MSMLRLLSPGRPAHHTSGPSSRPYSDQISLQLHLPTFGSLFMKPPDDPLWPHARSEGPRDDQLLSGMLEIQVPAGASRRCRSVRVGVRTKSRLNMGQGRGWEEDVIFERKVEMMGGNSDGILLDEGVQRFEFTLIIPSTFAPHDWHHNGKVNQELFAELEGLPLPSSHSALSLFGLGSSRRGSASPSMSKRGSFSGSPSRSPSPIASPLSLSPMLAAAGSLSITRQEIALPEVPSYEQSQADPFGLGPPLLPSKGIAADDWIVGTHEAVREIMVMHNPNPTGNFSDLDMRQQGVAPGIGVWDLKIFSDVFSIGGPIHARLTLPSLNPKTTIFSWRLQLRQTHTLTSPRDEEAIKPITTVQHFDIISQGARPAQGVRYPGLEHAALWRGDESGGEDKGEMMIEGSASMPKDDRGRPTTLPGLITPINVSHMLVYEVYFSVWGEDDRGQPMPHPGPGGLRFLQVTKPLILPSCALIPSLLDLPMYSVNQCLKPCKACGRRPVPSLCVACPTTSIPHPPHADHKSPIPLCPSCPDRKCEGELDPFSIGRPREWRLCACGLDPGKIAMRMKAFATEGIRADGGEWAEARWREEKEVGERGRAGSGR